MRAVYLDPAAREAPPSPYRTGEIGTVHVTPDGELEMRAGLALSANSAHALIGHGVVERLNALPIEGRIGQGLEALVPPSVLDAMCEILYEADRRTYGGSWEFVVARVREPEPLEYRIRIDNREYQASLTRMQFLVSQAGRDGVAVWIRI